MELTPIQQSIKKDLTNYAELLEGTSSRGRRIFNQTVSLDVEALVNINKRSSDVEITEAGFFDPRRSAEENSISNKYFTPKKQTYASYIRSESKLPADKRFQTNRLANILKDGAPISPEGFKGDFSIITDYLNKGSNVGVSNLNFEAKALFQQYSGDAKFTKDTKGMFFDLSPGEVPGKALHHSYGGLLGNDKDIAIATADANSKLSKFRNTVPNIATFKDTFNAAREATVDVGTKIAHRLQETGEVGLLHDQQSVYKAYIAQAIGKGQINTADWTTGTSIDSLLRGTIGVKESHGAVPDAAAAQHLSSSMSDVLLGGEDTPSLKSLHKNFAELQLETRRTSAANSIDNLLGGSSDSPIFQSRERQGRVLNKVVTDDVGNVVSNYDIQLPGKAEAGIGREELKAFRGTVEQAGEQFGDRIRSHYEGLSNMYLPKDIDGLVTHAIGAVHERAVPKDIATKLASEAAEAVQAAAVKGEKGLGQYAIEKMTPRNLAIGVGLGLTFIAGRQLLMGMNDELPPNNFQAIRQSHPTNPNEFEAIKPGHPDFAGGRTPFNPESMKMLAKGVAGAGGLLAFLHYSRQGTSFINPDTSEWGRASKFGVASRNMMSGVAQEFDEEMNSDSKSIVTHGTYIHEEYQKKFLDMFPDAIDEYAILDMKNKITGHIDFVAPIVLPGEDEATPMPIEIKTIGGKAFGSMTGIKPEHAAQSQYYLHYLTSKYKKNIPYETFVYINRDNPNQIKIFKERRNEKLFQRYLARYRQYQNVAEENGYTPQKLTSNVKIAKEVLEQSGDRHALETSRGRSMEETQIGLHQAAVGYNPRPFNGIRRSDKHGFDFDSPHKKIWNAPSAKIAKDGGARINVLPPVRNHSRTKIPMTGYNENSKKGQIAKYGSPHRKSRSVNSSRAGVM